MLSSKNENAHWAEKKEHNALWLQKNSHNTKFCVVAVFKEPQCIVALEKQQHEMSCKWIVYKLSNLLIKNTCNVGLIKNNGRAHLFLQELLGWRLELHFIFFKRHLHFLLMQCLLQWRSLQIPAYFHTLSLRLTKEIVNLRAHHVPLNEVVVSSCEFVASIQSLK
jgi:hypothetical protein